MKVFLDIICSILFVMFCYWLVGSFILWDIGYISKLGEWDQSARHDFISTMLVCIFGLVAVLQVRKINS